MKIRLSDFREMHHLRQVELAELLGTKQSVISRAERAGLYAITLPQYNTLCEKFGKDDVDAYLEASPMRNQPKPLLSKNNDQMVDAITRLSNALVELSKKQAEQTDRLLNILEKLSEKK